MANFKRILLITFSLFIMSVGLSSCGDNDDDDDKKTDALDGSEWYYAGYIREDITFKKGTFTDYSYDKTSKKRGDIICSGEYSIADGKITITCDDTSGSRYIEEGTFKYVILSGNSKRTLIIYGMGNYDAEPEFYEL